MVGDLPHKDLLRRVWLFADLDDADLDRIASVSRPRTCADGEVLVSQGDSSGELFTVIQGRVKVQSVASDGEEVLLSLLGPGEVFGELALLDDKPRSATVVAAERCRLLVVSRASFRSILVQVPSLGVRLLQILAGHVRRLSTRLEDFAALDVRTRLARALLDLGTRFGMPGARNSTRITLRLSQQELGRLVGATREMVNKCLREWANRRIVQHARGFVLIVNERTLQTIAWDAPAPRSGRRPAQSRNTTHK
jgi:CRP/FNR family cyclic AMP-dependent transcriptional regulator